ncbi:MAG: tyrosine-type recombinase/integrase [Turicibacter sp.]|nr:tyrosine-type recombinase/integrase [Turicibacter sp.]
MDIKNEIKGYLSYCENQKKLNPKSIKAYSVDLAQFTAHLEKTGENGITKTEIHSYIADLHNTFNPKSVKRKLASLRAFINYLEFEEILAINPFRKIKTKFQEPKILPKIIPLETISQILSVAYGEYSATTTEYERFIALRNMTIIELLFATGMRVSELCSLRIDDVNLINGCINIVGKGAKERIIQLGSEDVLQIVQKYYRSSLSRINKSHFFFVNKLSTRLSEQSVRFMLKNLSDKANIGTKITPHMFRHSFATFLLEEDVDIRYIQKMLGHSSIQTTQIYTQVSTKKQRQILAEKHPRNKIKIRKKLTCDWL